MARRPRPRLRSLLRPNGNQLRHSRLSCAQPRQEDSMGATRHSHRRGAMTLQDSDAEQPASALQMEVTSRRWTTTSEELDTARTKARHAEEEPFRSNTLDRTHLVDAQPILHRLRLYISIFVTPSRVTFCTLSIVTRLPIIIVWTSPQAHTPYTFKRQCLIFGVKKKRISTCFRFVRLMFLSVVKALPHSQFVVMDTILLLGVYSSLPLSLSRCRCLFTLLFSLVTVTVSFFIALKA